MCGIAGFISFGGHDPARARARVQGMTDAIVYRGPDEEGFYVDGHVALGHRRLAIIDLNGGQQPMSVLDGRVQIVFNGEIYNYRNLREELEKCGHRFQSQSDTEVILVAYLQWGETCATRLNGMFAFVIWDARSNTAFLARDRVGKKPLYYCRTGETFAFASELKSLRSVELCPTQIDSEALDCYFTFGYIPAPKTIYRDVKKLRAAHTLTVSRSGETQRHYWKLSFAPQSCDSPEQVVDEFEALLDDAVRTRLMSEVPLGAFLSGGLDSSLVVASMSRAMTGRPVITNSIGFEEKEFSELAVARAVSEHLQTDHHEFVVKPDASDVLPRIARHFDEPLADSSSVPTWYVCEMARRKVTVALSGDGGDEAFAGYTFRYVPHMMESRVRNALPSSLRSAIFGSIGAAWPGSARLPRPLRLKTIFENLAVGDAEAFYRDLAWLRPDTRQGLYSGDFFEALNGFTPMEMVQPFYVGNDAQDALGRSQFTDIHFYMTDDVLVKVDRMSMAHSLEVRSPLLDHRILEFAARLPTPAKIVGQQGKLPLRALAARRLPEQIRRMPKRGFSIPAAQWLRTELREQAQHLLFRNSSALSNVIETRMLRRVWDAHLNGSRDHSVLIWALMMFGLWEKSTQDPLRFRAAS